MSAFRADLLERDDELHSLNAAFAAAQGGEGGVVVIRGPVGIGKTELLRAALADARERGLRTLLARASEFEGGLPLGVVRQLLEPMLARCSPAEQDTLFTGAASLARTALQPATTVLADPVDVFPMLHGLYWLCANLADQGPLVLAVDDLQWADPASQRWVAYLAHRVDSLPVLLLVTLRAEASGLEDTDLPEHLTERAASTIHPAPLSAGSVAVLVEGGLGAVPEDGFLQACHAATRGNPLFVRELLGGLRAQGVRPVDGEAASVEQIGPRTVARQVRDRLRRLGPHAERLAQAAAIVGDDIDSVLLRDLVGIRPAEFAVAAGLLADADLVAVEPRVAFTHPITRAAINVSLSASTRAELSGGAARLLAARGELDTVAGHLLSVVPSGDGDVVATLRTAAAQALARGGPESAVELLLRALCEPPAADVQPDVLHELALAEMRTDASVAPVHLRAALEQTAPGPERARRADDLARALHGVLRVREALSVVEDELDRSSDGPARDRLAARTVEIAGFLPEGRRVSDRVEASVAAITDQTMAARVRGVRAYHAMAAGRPAATVAELARAALATGALATEVSAGSVPASLACIALAAAGDADGADRELALVLESAQRRGSVVSYCGALSIRARLRFGRGDLRGCEADALEISELGGVGIGRDYATGWLVESLVEQGRLEEAEQAVAGGVLAGEVPEISSLTPGLHARGRLRIAEGRLNEGLRDVLACGARQERLGATNPADLPWRATAALALLALDRADEAGPVAAEQLAAAERFGDPSTLGAALRIQGLLRGGPEGHALLERAVATLEAAPARLELARALLAAGAARHEAGDADAARLALGGARELAEELGAVPLEQEAMAALLAAGGRPRRARARGAAALTPSERRTAEQAARGLTNREIAQTLFVTEKTVEGHLRNAFRKLTVSSRLQLAAALGAGTEWVEPG